MVRGCGHEDREGEQSRGKLKRWRGTWRGEGKGQGHLCRKRVAGCCVPGMGTPREGAGMTLCVVCRAQGSGEGFTSVLRQLGPQEWDAIGGEEK